MDDPSDEYFVLAAGTVGKIDWQDLPPVFCGLYDVKKALL